MNEIQFESNGTSLFAVEHGEGTPLVMYHGPTADHRAMLPMVGPLSSAHRVICPDARASGRSWYGEALSWDVLADDVVALLDHLGLDKAVIGGASGGTGVAVSAALRHPERVSALVLVTPVYAGRAFGLTDNQKSAFMMMGQVGALVRAQGIEALKVLYQGLPDAIMEQAWAMARSFDPASVAETTRFIAEGSQPFGTVADLARIEAPTFMVPGADPLHPPEISQMYAEHLPSVEVGQAEWGMGGPELVAKLSEFLGGCSA